MWEEYLQPTTLEEALELLGRHAGTARIIAGGTDVMVELQRGVRPTARLVDISRLRELDYVRAEGGRIALGALATHNAVLASPACVAGALPLAQACLEVGAPQIRARATVAGNLVTASPANDTITPLMALGAELVLASSQGERVVPLREFYLGVRRTVLRPDELLREIRCAALGPQQRGLFLKLGLRRAQAIAVLNLACVVGFEGDQVAQARITLGCLAPTIVHAEAVEGYLRGKQLTPEVCRAAAELAAQAMRPIDDVRGSAAYRQETLVALLAHALERIAAGRHAEGWPARPVLLETARATVHATGQPSTQTGAGERASTPGLALAGETKAAPEETGRALASADGPASATVASLPEPTTSSNGDEVIETTINGQLYRLRGARQKTLLDALREDAGLTGTKEGCAEGECGACTVWLDGQAVMACLVPAPQAAGAQVTTIEGLAGPAGLHPLQRAFINRGAVQCGYCIPGMLMAGARLLQEHPRPTTEQIKSALSGNICRCTGYRKILEAVEEAGAEL